MLGLGLLSGLTFLPLVGVAFLLTQNGNDPATLRNIRWATLLTTLATFALSLVAWSRKEAGLAPVLSTSSALMVSPCHLCC